MKQLGLALIAFVALAVSSVAQEKIVNAYGTVPQLLQLNPNTPNNIVVVQGLAAVTDGYGGIFAYDGISAVSTNTTNAFKPISYDGRWLRQSPQAVFVQAGSATTSANSTVTNTFSAAFATTPRVILSQTGTATTVTNVVTVTTSNFVWNAGAPSITGSWIAIASP